MDANQVTQAEGKDPSGFLSEIINSAVTVKLNSGVVYKGKLYYNYPLVPYISYYSTLAPDEEHWWELRGGTPWEVRINGKADEETGELQSVDGYMNIALEKCEEHVNGVKKRSYGDAFIRGNNGSNIPPSA